MLSIGHFLSAIEDYLEAKRAAKDGTYDEIDGSYNEELEEIKKRVAMSLNGLVDFRLDGVIELRKKRANSTNKNITVPDPDMEWADVISIVEALNCSPTPIDDSTFEEMVKNGKLKEWIDCYNTWYAVKRFNALHSSKPAGEAGRYFLYGDDLDDK